MARAHILKPASCQTPNLADAPDGFVENSCSQGNLTKLLGLPVAYRVTTTAAA